MENILASNEAYEEFKDYLDTYEEEDFSYKDESGNKKYGIRLKYIGMG